MCPGTSTNGLPWPDRHSRASSRSTTSSEPRNSPDRIGRPAVVEVQRDATEQMVAGDHQPALGLEQAHVRGSVARASRTPSRCRDRYRSARPSTSGRFGLDHARDPGRHVANPLGVAPRARPRGRRSGGPPRSSAPAPAPDRRPIASRARGWGASTARIRRGRRSSPPGPSGPSGRGCRPAGCTCSTRSRTCSIARSSCAIDPGWCMPVSTSTIPDPAAIAHALQCGTPGHGSGRRSRHSPGRTRSPRPSSRTLVIPRTILPPRRLRRCDEHRDQRRPALLRRARVP